MSIARIPSDAAERRRLRALIREIERLLDQKKLAEASRLNDEARALARVVHAPDRKWP